MRQIEFLVEEPSAKEALKNLVPKILVGIPFNIRAFQGKEDLIKNLLAHLKAYKNYIDENCYIVIVIDKDIEDCNVLKDKLEKITQEAGFVSRSKAKEGKYQVINRIAIEELEAWCFGDVVAINAAYKKISLNIANQEKYREPDAITGGTAEALERLLKDKKYCTRMRKIEVARNISVHMDPERNTSKSFQVFRDALKDLKK